ncbi:MAG: DUF1934 family protein [Ruminococcus sp.]|nr:DUF1934 family protein [Ruminococcus sp.]
MEYNANLKLRSVSEEQTQDESCSCRYEQKENVLEIAYSDTLIRVFKDEAVIERTGEMRFKMPVKPGEKAHCEVQTELGSFTLEVFGRGILVRERSDGLNIFISYDSGIDSESMQTTRLSLKLENKKML